MSIVIVGTGLAGYNLAKEIRKQGFQGALTLITQDDGAFYSKPMLSNAFAKNKQPDQLVIATVDEMMEQLSATIITNSTVCTIDRQAQHVSYQISDGHEPDVIKYDKLVLALGATPNLLPCLASDQLSASQNAAKWRHHGLYSINSLVDYRQFRSGLEQHLLSFQERVDASRLPNRPFRIGIIGGGLIGCELANDLAGTVVEQINKALTTSLEIEITIIEPMGRSLASLLPEPVSQPLEKAFSELGIQWIYQTVTDIQVEEQGGLSLSLGDPLRHRGDGDNGGMGAKPDQKELLKTAYFDCVISAIGMKANTNLAAEAGLSVNRGIVVNRQLQTSDPNIFALGDCAEVDGHLLFYILPIMACVRVLGTNLLLGSSQVERSSQSPLKCVEYDAMPVAVKTPSFPLVIASPPRDSIGSWVIEQGETEGDIKALFKETETDNIVGFVLSGGFTGERNALKKQLPKLH